MNDFLLSLLKIGIIVIGPAMFIIYTICFGILNSNGMIKARNFLINPLSILPPMRRLSIKKRKYLLYYYILLSVTIAWIVLFCIPIYLLISDLVF
jgi:hypothetical protein